MPIMPDNYKKARRLVIPTQSLGVYDEVCEQGEETRETLNTSIKDTADTLSDTIKDTVESIKDTIPDYNEKLDEIYACVESLKDIEIEVEIV